MAAGRVPGVVEGMRLTLSLLAIVLSGCGYTSPGGGTGTLFVSARITGDGSTSGSRARVVVREGNSGGVFVRNAEVAIRGGALARTILPFDSNRDDYRLDGFLWVEGLRLEVIRGNDILDGSIEAPGATVITEPVANTTFSKAAGQPLLIRWKDARGAGPFTTTVRLDQAKLDPPVPGGAVQIFVEPGQLVVDDQESVRVERVNEISLAGGAAGSTLSASTEHEIEFKVE